MPRKTATLVLVACGASFLMGAENAGSSAKTVQAQRIEIVDDEGQVRAWLGLEGDDVVFVMSDDRGAPRTQIRAGRAAGSALTLHSNRGEPLVMAGVDAQNRPGMAVLAGGKSTSSVVLTATPDDAWVATTAGTTKTRLPAAKE